MKEKSVHLKEAELNAEAIKAAGWYIQNQGKHLPMIEQQNMANHVAHGFVMGWKASEKRQEDEAN